MTEHPVTPDGRYFLARGRLWRRSDPALPQAERESAVAELMSARRAVKTARAASDETAERTARDRVDAAKQRLGERGPVWWSDGAPDQTRRKPANTPYAAWAAALGEDAPSNDKA